MKLLRFVFTLGPLAFVAGLGAATTPAGRVEDLGQGLTYVRPAQATPESLALLKSVSGPAVLDLRYFSSEKPAAHWLAAIKAFATPKRVCLILVTPETSPVLLIGLAVGVPDCITLGRSSPSLQVDIAVATSAETDRKAWDAIGQDTPLDKLIAETLDKPRYDEAVLAKEHAAELNAADSAPAEDSADAAGAPAAGAPEKPAKAPEKPRPLIDAVLQRAVQIDRGLLALRKL